VVLTRFSHVYLSNTLSLAVMRIGRIDARSFCSIYYKVPTAGNRQAVIRPSTIRLLSINQLCASHFGVLRFPRPQPILAASSLSSTYHPLPVFLINTPTALARLMGQARSSSVAVPVALVFDARWRPTPGLRIQVRFCSIYYKVPTAGNRQTVIRPSTMRTFLVHLNDQHETCRKFQRCIPSSSAVSSTSYAS
jgi:hypothetical protein